MARDVSVISSMATRRVLVDLASSYRGSSGQRMLVEAVGGVDAVRRVRAGEAFDIAILAADALDALAADGVVERDSVREFVRSQTTVAVPAGATVPDRCDDAAIRQLVKSANKIGLSTGPSGVGMAKVLATWEGEAVASRIVTAPPGVPVARLLAEGRVEVGFQQMSELLGEPGITIVGPVPTSIQPLTVFSLARCRTGLDRAAADHLIEFLIGAGALAAKQRSGLEPGIN